MVKLDLGEITQYDIITLIAFILLYILFILTPVLLIYWIKTNPYKDLNEFEIQ